LTGTTQIGITSCNNSENIGKEGRSKMGKPQQRYDVYDNGELLHEDKTAKEIQILLGLQPKYVLEYASRCVVYKKRWQFTVHGEEIKIKNDFTCEDALRWEAVRKAYFLLKTDKGIIVCEGGKKYTKRK
jgi:hypothetical protein